MSKIKYVLLVLLLLVSVNVKAAEKCESDELARLKELAKKVELDYDYTVENGIANFSIRAVNLNEDLLVLVIEDYYAGKYQEFKESNGGILSGFKSGERVVVTIKGFVPNRCSGVTVLTKTVKLPYYNIFYSPEKCNGNEDFKYCKLLLSSNISEKEFNRQYELYIQKKGQGTEQEEEKEKKDYTTLYRIIGGVVLVGGITSVIVINVIKRRKKNEL